MEKETARSSRRAEEMNGEKSFPNREKVSVRPPKSFSVPVI
jgi:hypothetical protein